MGNFRCCADALGIDLALVVPPGLAGLLSRVLSGWTISKSDIPPDVPDIQVSGAGVLRLTSPHYTSGRSYDDIISILNEILVAVAYACRAAIPHTSLIHAAGFSVGRQAEVVFGARKAGKSVLTARRAAAGDLIYADDLLLWAERKLYFVGLGLAPRLRRPVLDDILVNLPKDAFIAGAYTCYLDKTHIDLAPAGSNLRPDYIRVLQPDQTLSDISLLQIKSEIMAHRIP